MTKARVVPTLLLDKLLLLDLAINPGVFELDRFKHKTVMTCKLIGFTARHPLEANGAGVGGAPV